MSVPLLLYCEGAHTPGPLSPGHLLSFPSPPCLLQLLEEDRKIFKTPSAHIYLDGSYTLTVTSWLLRKVQRPEKLQSGKEDSGFLSQNQGHLLSESQVDISYVHFS